ncbi:MAG: PAS domain-containing protein [Gammaproteobacteria bacterium]|jgi:signal transduction histidine kinase|nr:PAS domain-containing protein [Gammaproteobacteria bacterium]
MNQHHLFEHVVTQLSIGACIVDPDLNIVFWNNFFADRLQLQSGEVQGKSILTLFPEQAAFLKRKLQSVFVLKNASYSYWEQRPVVFQFKSSRPITGEECQMFQNVEIYPIFDDEQQVSCACITVHDMTVTASYHQELTRLTLKLEEEKAQQQQLIQRLEEAQNQLLQSEKMAAIGQLAAGVAHEINNPVGFIFSNLQTLQEYLQKMGKYIDLLGKIIDKVPQNTLHAMKADYVQRNQLEMVLSDCPELVAESLEGADRVMAIVKSLKEFSHVDSTDWQEADITQGIESTLRILSNELKYKAEVVRHYAPDLPHIYCQPMQLNQVFMNLLVNAAQAIETFGKIEVSVREVDNALEIKVQDSGSGIAPEHLKRIFEPFFTTKPVGKGTGLGLSLSYSIIHRHQGQIKVTSEIGKGTCFTLHLPLLTPEMLTDAENSVRTDLV